MHKTTFTGTHLARQQNPIRMTWPERIMIASLAAAMIFALAGLVLNELNNAEIAYQLDQRV